jgi:hypothetical protein
MLGQRLGRCGEQEILARTDERKRAYLAHLPDASPDALRVSIADKLHNARTVLNDYRNIGDKLWARFNKEASKKDQLDYYQALVTAFRRADAPLQWWPSLIGS